jgi:hypothetical protein
LIGPATAARAQIASQLVQHLSPLGFVFLAQGGPTLSPRAIREVLSHTELYIWSPENGESFARRQALDSGAVPCKIDDTGSGADGPGSYRSVTDLAARLALVSLDELLAEAVSAYGRLHV